MKVILWKLLSDFRLAKGKLLLLLLAASLSGWGISSVVYSYFMTERDFEENFVQTYPADMAVTIDNYTEGLEEKFLADPNVIDIERREAISARIKDRQDNWMPMVLFAVDDLNFMRYDRFKILEEADKAPGNILIEQNAYYYLHEDQASIELQFQGKEEVTTWKVAGKAHDARLAPARMEGVVYGFSTSIQRIEPYLVEGRRRLLIKTNVSSDRQLLQDVYERIKTTTEQSGGRIVGAVIPIPGKHIHQGIVDGVAFLQKSGGIILSIMGIILLSLILLTWVLPRVSDIGVMKAIGASTRRIFISYTFVLGIIIMIGLMVGMPLGYKTATLYNGLVSYFQNFEVVTAMLPFYVHAIVVFIGMVIPLLFGMSPLSRGAKTSVNEAMNRIFYTPHKGFFHLSQRLVSSSRLKYMLNNLLRHSQRTMLTILLIAVGVALFFTASNVEHSIRTDLGEFARNARYEVGVTLPYEMEKEDIYFLDELPFIESISPMNTSRITYIPPTKGYPEISIVRVLSQGIVIDDNYVQRGKINKNCKQCIYVSDENMRVDFEAVELGDPVELTYPSGETITYIFSGVIRDLVVINSPFFIYNDEDTKKFNSLAFALESGLSDQEIFDASNAIDDVFIDNGINLRRRSSVRGRMLSIMNHLVPTFLIIKTMGIFTIILGLLGLLIVLNLTIQERTREIGIMKAIGSPYRKISSMFKQEFMLISLFAIFLGGLVAMPVAKALIDVIAETVIRHPVPFRNDFFKISATIAIILVVQTILISIYNRFKIGKNARELLDHNF